MEFNNLNPNILNFLHNEWRDLEVNGTIDTQRVFEKFSNISVKNIRDALYSMQRKDLIKIILSEDRISLTRKGMSKKSIEALLIANRH
jgi:hypothetical protein